MKRIVIDLDDNWKLVAEVSYNPHYPRELYVGLVNGNDIWSSQDLVIIRQSYEYDVEYSESTEIKYKDSFDVLVYADPEDEDYTNSFTINKRKGETL